MKVGFTARKLGIDKTYTVRYNRKKKRPNS